MIVKTKTDLKVLFNDKKEETQKKKQLLLCLMKENDSSIQLWNLVSTYLQKRH
jgi:predicted Zn-dependent peptidase